jgi:hypothetical protein
MTASDSLLTLVSKNTKLDVNDSRALIFFNNLANKSLPAGTCNFNLAFDSWRPGPTIACGGDSVERGVCADISSTGLCPLGCYSFAEQLDLTGVAGDTNPGADQWLTKLRTRYGAGCNYATYVSQLKNYDATRQAKMTALRATLQSSIYSHLATAQSAFTTLSNSLSTLSNSLSSSPHFSTSYGSTSGLDCFAI